MTKPISTAQMRRLQTLYGQLCAHTQQPADREARIGWAQALVQRPIKSFNDLDRADAKHLIDTLQAQLGIAPTRPDRPRLDRRAARKAGTEGRRGSAQETLAGPREIELVTAARDRLGWSQARLDAFLRSPSSPLPNRDNPSMHTLWAANRVYWALKRMAERKERSQKGCAA